MKRKKLLALVVTVSIVTGSLIGGTLAWLTDKTDSIENTFTVGNVDIDLTETTGENYKMIPGVELSKDPTVTVEAGSEACWLFVKVEENVINVTEETEPSMPTLYSFDDFITYEVDVNETNGWKALSGEQGVYYRFVESLVDSSEDLSFSVIGYFDENDNWISNSVFVKETVTKEMMDKVTAAGEESFPKLTFTAYAIQAEGMESADVAWAEISK